MHSRQSTPGGPPPERRWGAAARPLGPALPPSGEGGTGGGKANLSALRAAGAERCTHSQQPSLRGGAMRPQRGGGQGGPEWAPLGPGPQ